MRTRSEWLGYLAERKGSYEMRTARYSLVADKLELIGLADGDLIVDVGAGMCEFGRYMYRDRGWSGRYLPVDGAIDGIDLDYWKPFETADFFVAIEVLEHLEDWRTLVGRLSSYAEKGIVVTTPNTATLGERAVLEMDETHVSPLYPEDLWMLNVETVSLFGRGEDTIVGWRGR